MDFIIKKGSVTIDGISLTVTDLDATSFSVSIIEHTQGETTLTKKNIGDTVNIENDVVGKYVKKFIMPENKINGISFDFLENNGF